MKYETFDQPAYGVGDLETFGITDNSGSLIMDFSSDSRMESWRADILLSEDLQAYSQVSRAHEMGGDGGTNPPPPPPPGGSDDDDTGTDDSSGDTSGSGDTGSGDDDEDGGTTTELRDGYCEHTGKIEGFGDKTQPEDLAAMAYQESLEFVSGCVDPENYYYPVDSGPYMNTALPKSDEVFNEDNLINQITDFDTRYSKVFSLDGSASCQTVAVIHANAILSGEGISQESLDKVVLSSTNNGLVSDGSIHHINVFGNELAKAAGRDTYYGVIENSEEDGGGVYSISGKEFVNSDYEGGIGVFEKNIVKDGENVTVTHSQLLENEDDIKNETPYTAYDSLDPKRETAKGYSLVKVYPLVEKEVE